MQCMEPSRFQEGSERIPAGVHRRRPDKVVLFGSFARGDSQALSDIDLLSIKETDRPFAERIEDVLVPCDASAPSESPVCTPEESERVRRAGDLFVDQVLREGEVVYQTVRGGLDHLASVIPLQGEEAR